MKNRKESTKKPTISVSFLDLFSCMVSLLILLIPVSMVVWWGLDHPMEVRDLFVGKPYYVFPNYVIALSGIIVFFWVHFQFWEWLNDEIQYILMDFEEERRLKKIRRKRLAQTSSHTVKPPNTPLPVGYQQNGQGWFPMHLCLRQLREKKGMSQAELAEKSGISQEFIRDIEEGHKIPGIFVAKRLAQTLGVSVDELIVEEK